MHYSTIFIDLDETVYPTSCGVWDAISDRMEQYMHDRLNLQWEEIPALRKDLYHTYGTTLRGLQNRYQVNEREFIDYVHDIPLDQFLQPDPELRQVLMSYPVRKIIFTNADRNHASRIIDRLQLNGCFDGTIDIYDISPFCKPMPEAFQIALAAAGESRSDRCIFIDDSPGNLKAARELGFYTVQVGSPKEGFQHPLVAAHAAVSRLHDLPKVLHPLLQDETR